MVREAGSTMSDEPRGPLGASLQKLAPPQVGPFRDDAFRSPLHSVRVASILGIALGVTFTVCFVTGFTSHLIQHPPSFFTWPPRPAWLFRVSQGCTSPPGSPRYRCCSRSCGRSIRGSGPILRSARWPMPSSAWRSCPSWEDRSSCSSPGSPPSSGGSRGSSRSRPRTTPRHGSPSERSSCTSARRPRRARLPLSSRSTESGVDAVATEQAGEDCRGEDSWVRCSPRPEGSSSRPSVRPFGRSLVSRCSLHGIRGWAAGRADQSYGRPGEVVEAATDPSYRLSVEARDHAACRSRVEDLRAMSWREADLRSPASMVGARRLDGVGSPLRDLLERGRGACRRFVHRDLVARSVAATARPT